jgi:hypothetical protein
MLACYFSRLLTSRAATPIHNSPKKLLPAHSPDSSQPRSPIVWRGENLGGDFETPAIEDFFEDHSDLRFVIFAKRFSCAARIDAGDDCIASRIGIAIERLSRSGAGVRA